jgi:hypothetical protein
MDIRYMRQSTAVCLNEPRMLDWALRMLVFSSGSLTQAGRWAVITSHDRNW